MRCAQQRQEKLVLLHAHGQLGGVQAWLVDGHLRECPTCRAVWARCIAERDSLTRAVRPLPAGDKREEFAQAVLSRIQGLSPVGAVKPPGAGKQRFTLALASALLALALSAAAGYVPLSAPAFWGQREGSGLPVVRPCIDEGEMPAAPRPASAKGSAAAGAPANGGPISIAPTPLFGRGGKYKRAHRMCTKPGCSGAGCGARHPRPR